MTEDSGGETAIKNINRVNKKTESMMEKSFFEDLGYFDSVLDYIKKKMEHCECEKHKKNLMDTFQEVKRIKKDYIIQKYKGDLEIFTS